jgi:hypothetical protein
MRVFREQWKYLQLSLEIRLGPMPAVVSKSAGFPDISGILMRIDRATRGLDFVPERAFFSWDGKHGFLERDD